MATSSVSSTDPTTADINDAGTAEKVDAKDKDHAEKLFAGLTAADSPTADRSEALKVLASPIEVIPLDDHRDDNGNWSLRVQPTNAGSKISKYLSGSDEVSLSDAAIARLVQSMVDPSSVGSTVAMRTEFGWLNVITTRLFTPSVNVAVENDRWVADSLYGVSYGSRVGELCAIPLPTGYPGHAELVHGLPRKELLEAADLNFKHVLAENLQDVGRRLIEQPVTLVATRVGRDDEGDEIIEFCTVDGNGRVASGMQRLKIRVDWLPQRLLTQEPYRSIPRGREIDMIPSLLMNLTVAERRTLVRRIAKQSTEILSRPAKSPGDRSYKADLEDRNKAAAALNCLTVPARVIVGFRDDDAEKYGATRFASAVRALLVQMNVENKPLDVSAKHAVNAEEIVVAFEDEGIIDSDTCTAVVGRSDVTTAMQKLGLDPGLPDLQAALAFYVMCQNDQQVKKILKNKVKNKGQIHGSHRSSPAVELAMRAYTSSVTPDDLKDARKVLDPGKDESPGSAVWDDLMRPWQVINIADDEDVDLLAGYAHDQLSSAAGTGPLLRLLGVLGMFALTVSGHLRAPGGSTEARVGGSRVDRGKVATIMPKLLKHHWGIDLLTDAIKRYRAGEKSMRWFDNQGGLTDDGLTPADFDANLRKAIYNGSVISSVITKTNREDAALEAVIHTVEEAKEKLADLIHLRAENGTGDRLLRWVEVEPTVNLLDVMSDNLRALSKPRALEAM